MVIFVLRGFLVLDAMCATKKLQGDSGSAQHQHSAAGTQTCQFTVDFAASRHHYLVHFPG
jgi:hypothetical protein